MKAVPAVRHERARELSTWLRERAGVGVLAFPLTAFTPDGRGIDVGGFRAHLRRHLDAGAGALFVCCGTGEFSALDEVEYAELVAAAVTEVAGQVPIIAGTGYGWAQARRFATIAEEAGTDGLLLLPHYLVRAPQSGMVTHVERISETTDLPIVLYQRGLVQYTRESVDELAKIPSVIGLKDGVSDYVDLQRMTLYAAPDFLFFNGALTAEIQYRPYESIGITPYSSAVHSCAPEIASTFFAATRRDDTETMNLLLREFYSPLVRLRDKVPGYAVSLIKATARMRGEQVGPVREPLLDPAGEDLAELERLMRHGLALVGAEF